MTRHQPHCPRRDPRRRNIIVLGDLEETITAADTAQSTIAGYALTEINGIIDNLSQPV
jgi:hypothetical protein